MTMVQSIGSASDRVIATLIAGLEIEFGSGAGAGLAARFLAAEEADFRWDARIEECWLGSYEGDDEQATWLDRVAIAGRLDGIWFAATMIIDGEGEAQGMLACRTFEGRAAAVAAMRSAH